MSIEIERKFLVDPNMPITLNWYGFFHLHKYLKDRKDIKQTYLLPNKENDIARVRKEIDLSSKITTYTFNSKKPIGAGISEETEVKLTKEEYKLYLCMKDPHKIPIIKSRMSFDYNDLVFELDYFHKFGRLPEEISSYSGKNTLVLLEVELHDINQKIEMPPFINILKEVTNDDRYKNVNLAEGT